MHPVRLMTVGVRACPECRGPGRILQSRAVQLRRTGTLQHRRRLRCENCGTRWTTIERVLREGA